MIIQTTKQKKDLVKIVVKAMNKKEKTLFDKLTKKLNKK